LNTNLPRSLLPFVWIVEEYVSMTERTSTHEQDRRAFLAQASKAAVVVPPAMMMLLSTSMNSPAIAQSSGTGNGNNGVGNGIDPQPPGNPPINDGPGTGPGNPGAKGRNG
jgi:hypothetical protein